MPSPIIEILKATARVGGDECSGHAQLLDVTDLAGNPAFHTSTSSIGVPRPAGVVKMGGSEARARRSQADLIVAVAA
jgi:hypothetical protein